MRYSLKYTEIYQNIRILNYVIMLCQDIVSFFNKALPESSDLTLRVSFSCTRGERIKCRKVLDSALAAIPINVLLGNSLREQMRAQSRAA